jgi:small redox-active disulfide protein 2
MEIQILGTGCLKCKTLEANAKTAVEQLKIKANIVKITDVNQIINYGVMSTPAIAIDGHVKSSGHVATVDEIKKFLKQEGN